MKEFPYYAMTTLYPPTVIDMPVSGKRYAISGSTWIEVTPEITQEMVQNAWTPLYVRRKEPLISETKNYTVTSSRTGEKYTVSQVRGEWSCSCMGFEYRKKCKHVEQIKKEIK
jgi:hypothetical protein